MDAAQQLAGIVAAWNAAAQPWTPDRLSAIYTSDAMLFGGRPGHSVGAQGIADYFASYDGIIERASLDLTDQEIRVLSGDTFLAQGFCDFDFILAGDVETRSRLRTTLLIKNEGGWKILSHHFSPVPAAPPLGN